mmetsp:Transcript_105153/g.307327  ORF Transcript_105153/g.307327 Transcript_105153/m.307327 type:complete len:233 (-) Transcript_105153:38-736(-)
MARNPRLRRRSAELSCIEGAARAGPRCREERQQVAENSRRLQSILRAYDEDGSRSLDRREAQRMLGDYSLQAFGKDERPSEEDVDFLFRLCDSMNGDSDGQISGAEILQVCDTWGAYLVRGQQIKASLEKCSAQKGGKLDAEGLHQFLQSLNDGVEVPREVTQWVLAQADLAGDDGCLNSLELLRAICAWYEWLGRYDPQGTPVNISGNIQRDDTLPTPEKTEKKSSMCCVL